VRRDDYLARFNHGVRTGDWSQLLELLTDDCVLEFEGIPVGPFHGKAAIAEAYESQPPSDEIVDLGDDRYAWAADPETPAGVLHLDVRDGRVARIQVEYWV
jgi:steroid Delta-isomerase